MLTIPGAIFFITLAFVRMRTAQDELNVIALLLAIQAGLHPGGNPGGAATSQPAGLHPPPGD